MMAGLRAGDYQSDRDCSESEDRTKAHVCVHRTCFYAKAERKVYVMLPMEMRTGATFKCGRLRRAMYGTMDAAPVWQDEHQCTEVEAEVVQGLASPSLAVHVSLSSATTSS